MRRLATRTATVLVAAAAALVPLAAASAAPAAHASEAATVRSSTRVDSGSAARPAAEGNIAPGTSIGTAWPPLQGGVVYTESNSFAGWPQDWYSLYKTPDSNTATISIVNTSTSSTSSCSTINIYLYDNNGTADSPVTQSTQSAGGSVTFTIPGSLSTDAQGLYYLMVQGSSSWCADTGAATYTIAAEPGTEFGNPAEVPSQSAPPGTSIAAWPPLDGGISYTHANSFAGWPQDWYALYKTPDSTAATIRVANTTVDTPTSCGTINVYLYDNNGTGDPALAKSTLSADGAVTFTVTPTLSGDPGGLYYIMVQGSSSWCADTGAATYSIEPESAAEFTTPSELPSHPGAAGTSISTWPPLQGGTLYSATNYFANWPQDWYAVYKKPDSRTATIRVADTTVSTPTSCGTVNIYLYDNNGTADAALDQSTQAADGAVTFTLPGTLSGDPGGLYYVMVQGSSSWCADTGAATYSIEPEPAAEFRTPAQIPSVAATPATSIGGAWPPLSGGISYTHVNSFAGWPEDWYAVYKKPDSSTASIRVANATVNVPGGCGTINVYLYDDDGTANSALAQSTLPADGAVTFTLPPTLSGDPQGLYYLMVQGSSSWCADTGAATYSIEPEPDAQWGNQAIALPAGPSRKGAAGPLGGGVNYSTSLAAATAKEWAYFTTTGAATVRVQDTSASSAGCKLEVVAGSSSAALTAEQVTTLHVSKAGTYDLELAAASGCKLKAPLSALLELTGSIRGPVLRVTDPTLKTGTVKKAYRAAITVVGGKKPYAFTAITALPPGLSLNRKTGAVAGKPARQGTYTFMVTITDAAKPARHTVTAAVKIIIT